MIKLKNILAENMRRFGTKNLNETNLTDLEKIQFGSDRDPKTGNVKLISTFKDLEAALEDNLSTFVGDDVFYTTDEDDDIVYVIESGLAYDKVYNPETYCFNSGKLAISQGSAIQRCGRTGRTCAGICYKLYTKEQYN